MGHRLSKITTRTGDAGETGLGDGTRVAKDSARIAALGDIDELNSAIGLLFERGERSPYERITFALLTLEWLSRGQDRVNGRARR